MTLAFIWGAIIKGVRHAEFISASKIIPRLPIMKCNHPLSLRDISRQRETSERFCCLGPSTSSGWQLQAKGLREGQSGKPAAKGGLRGARGLEAMA
jgi:hypothetical protein